TATATIGGLPVSVSFAINATAGGASQMVKCGAIEGCATSGDGQTAVVGAALTNPLSVRVKDASNNPVPNVTVSWQVRTLGGGSLSAPTSVSNVNGIATINWTLGQVAGLHSVRATG